MRMKVLSEKNKEISHGIILCLEIILSISVLGTVGREIKGPFIFGDESAYFGLIKNLAYNHNYGGHTQYNPFYPIIMSLSFFQGNEVVAYYIIRFFNVLFFSLNIIPLYYICKKIFNKSIYWLWFPLFITFLPWKSTTYLIWAEPLYYLIFNCCMLSFMIYTQNKTRKNAVCLGLLLGLLFLTKQAGLVLIIAVFMSLVYENLFVERRNLEGFRLLVYVFGGVAILCLPWIVRNMMTPGAGVLGYDSEIKGFIKIFFEIVALIRSAMYQISYILLSTYIVLSVLFAILIIRIVKQKKEFHSFFILITLFTVGLVMLSSLHRVAGTDGKGTMENIELSYGRYISVCIPYIWLGAVYCVKENFQYIIKHKVLASVLTLTACAIAIVFTPIPSSTFSYGYLNNFDLSYLNDYINGYGQMVYKMTLDFGHTVVFIIPIIFCIMTLFFLNTNSKVKFLFLLSLSVYTMYTGVRSQMYYVKLSNNTKNENILYEYIINNGINDTELAIDKKLSNSKYLEYFWFGKELKRGGSLEVQDKVIVNFSTIDSAEDESTIVLRAPWHVESLYDNQSNSFGYDIEGIDARDSRIDLNNVDWKMKDLNFGWKNEKVYFELGKGKYKIKIFSDYTLMEGMSIDINYDIIINGKYMASCKLNEDNVSYVYEMDFENTDDIIIFEMIPAENCCWAINAMEIEALETDRDEDPEKQSIYYLISENQLGYPVDYQDEIFYLYDIRSDE